MNALAQQPLFVPQNVKKAYTNETRSADGKPGKNYWQNTGHYNIHVTVNPPSKLVQGSETITYINKSPKPLTNLIIKLILNIHNAGAGRQSAASADYLTKGILIDQFQENGKEAKFRDAKANTWTTVTLSKPVPAGDSVQLGFKWHYDVSEESGREGKLDSTSFFLAYFYPRVAVLESPLIALAKVGETPSSFTKSKWSSVANCGTLCRGRTGLPPRISMPAKPMASCVTPLKVAPLGTPPGISVAL